MFLQVESVKPPQQQLTRRQLPTELQEATGNFDSVPQKEGGRRLGLGRFGVVYYGHAPSEQLKGQWLEVAVKKLRPVILDVGIAECNCCQ